MSQMDRRRIEDAVRELLLGAGLDAAQLEAGGRLATTPGRVADAYAEFFAGLGVKAVDLLADSVEADTDELVLLRGIDFRSLCEHHLLPFSGVAHVAYLPAGKVVGLSALPRVVGALAARPQLQERLTEEIADTLVSGLSAAGVLVVLEAHQECVASRGVRQQRATAVTLAARGALAEPAARAEVIALIGGVG